MILQFYLISKRGSSEISNDIIVIWEKKISTSTLISTFYCLSYRSGRGRIPDTRNNIHCLNRTTTRRYHPWQPGKVGYRYQRGTDGAGRGPEGERWKWWWHVIGGYECQCRVEMYPFLSFLLGYWFVEVKNDNILSFIVQSQVHENEPRRSLTTVIIWSIIQHSMLMMSEVKESM